MADPESFKLGRNDEDSGLLLEEERQEQRLEKPNRRLTVFAILVPLVIGAMVAYAYVDLKTEFAAVKTGDVQKLARDLDSRFSSLSLQSAKLEETLRGRLAEFEKTGSDLAAQQRDLEKRLTALGAALPDMKALQQAISEITAQLAPLAAQVAAVDGTLDTLTRSTRESVEVLAALDQRLKTVEASAAQLSQDLAALSAAQLDRRELASTVEAAVATERKRFQSRLAEMADLYGASINTLQQRTDQLERAVTALANQAAAKSGKAPGTGLIFEHDLQ
jgi:chromosome segregation ATPase